MTDMVLSPGKIQKLKQYYQNKKLLLIGLNDSQGVNTTSLLSKIGFLDYLAMHITDINDNYQIINAFSLLFNKTEHINYFIDCNLNVEEIKLLQLYGAIASFEKIMEDLKLPKSLADVAKIYRTVYKINEGDKYTYLKTALEVTKEPIVIYSSGSNNIMREIGNNPIKLQKDYLNRKIKPDYDYTYQKASDPLLITKIINDISKNLDNILTKNSTTDIYILGSYIPKIMQKKNLKIFNNLVLEYNKKLEKLASNYGISFINTEKIGYRYNNNERDFHISAEGHQALAKEILEKIYNKKIVKQEVAKNYKIYDPSNNEEGLIQLLNLVDYEIDVVFENAKILDGFAKKRAIEIYKEHLSEEKAIIKVLKVKNLTKK